MIFQHSAAGRAGQVQSIGHALPFWLVLIVFESALWLLLALKFRQPCAPVALAAGLTLGLAVPMGGWRGWRGSLLGLSLAAITFALVLYGQAAFHASRVLGLSPLDALAGTGVEFAAAILDGLLSRADLYFIAAGLLLAVIFGFGYAPLRRRAA